MMCGGGSYSVAYDDIETETQLWKTSTDGKHVAFYADNSDCEGATEWCRAHCYMKTKPVITQYDPNFMSLDYNAKYFYCVGAVQRKAFAKDFLEAKYITFFASGTMSQMVSSNGETLRTIIREIADGHQNKVIRFFVRRPIRFEKVDNVGILSEHSNRLETKVPFPQNAVIVFSVDMFTHLSYVHWALKSKEVSMISIVDHPDNIKQIAYLKTQVKNVLTCEDCKENGYLCFKQEQKTLLIMKYITDEAMGIRGLN